MKEQNSIHEVPKCSPQSTFFNGASCEKQRKNKTEKNFIGTPGLAHIIQSVM